MYQTLKWSNLNMRFRWKLQTYRYDLRNSEVNAAKTDRCVATCGNCYGSSCINFSKFEVAGKLEDVKFERNAVKHFEF